MRMQEFETMVSVVGNLAPQPPKTAAKRPKSLPPASGLSLVLLFTADSNLNCYGPRTQILSRRLLVSMQMRACFKVSGRPRDGGASEDAYNKRRLH